MAFSKVSARAAVKKNMARRKEHDRLVMMQEKGS